MEPSFLSVVGEQAVGERLQQTLPWQHRPGVCAARGTAEQTPEQFREGTPGVHWGGAGWCRSLDAAGHPGWGGGFSFAAP